MKNIMIFTNLILAGVLVTGCTTRVEQEIPKMGLPLNTSVTQTSKDVSENNPEIEYVVVKEGSADENKAAAEKKAAEEAAKKAAEEAKKAAEEAAKQAAQNNASSNTTTGGSSSNSTGSTSGSTGSNSGSTSTPSRSENTTVRGVSVYISSSVSNSDYNRVIGWINNMPSFLLNHVSSVNVVDNISSYTIDGSDASGVTKAGHNIYLKAQGISGRLGSFYHEAGHCLDFYGGYSNSSTWQSICSAEWSGEGYYSAANEAFAEAISRYYVDGLSKSQTVAAIKNLINTGSLGSGDGFQAISKTLYANPRIIYVYSGPSDFYSEVITKVQIGESCQAIGINGDGTWYKVQANGVTGYVRADMVG